MEDELRSLQTKIMDLETKLSFAHHPDDLVSDAKRIQDVTQDKHSSSLKTRADSSDVDRT